MVVPSPCPDPAKRPCQDACGSPTTLCIPAWACEESNEDLGGAVQWSSDTVVLRMEVATNTECKLLAALSVFITLWALGGVVTETLIKLTRDPDEVLLDENARYFKTSLAIACLLLAILVGMLGTFTWRLWDARRSGRRWSPRRRRVALLSYAQLVVQTLNTALWLAQCAYLVGLTSELNTYVVALFGWGQWTLWNCEFLIIIIQGHGGNVWHGNRFTNSVLCGTKTAEADVPSGAAQPEKLVLDAPMTVHSLKLINWINFEVVVCLMTANLSYVLRDKDGRSEHPTVVCHPDTHTKVCILSMVVFALVYLCLYAVHMYNTFKQLSGRPYQQARLSNCLFRIQARQVALVFGTLVLCISLLLGVKLESCWTFVFMWFGMLPQYMAAVSMNVITAWYFMPANPCKKQILQTWLQEFAWTEASLSSCLERRNKHLAGSAALRSAPMFCMERAIRLLYFSCLIYDLEEVPGTPFDVDFALELYQMEGYELVWDRGVDVKALLAWNRDGRVVIAFRGTASVQNIKTDLKLWQVVHPPKRRRRVPSLWGFYRLPRVVMVHSGFWKAWAEALPSSSEQQRGGEAEEAGGTGQQCKGSAQPPMTPLPEDSCEMWQELQEQQRAGQQSAAGQPPPPCSSQTGSEPGGSTAWAKLRAAFLLSQAGAGQQPQQPPVPYNVRLVKRLEEIFKEHGVQQEGLSVHLTGHSLGGALASLCALSLRERWPEAQLSVYTFGQPRVGNRPFADEYNCVVGDHWSVICDQDPVPRVPKSTFKRCGSRVILNAQGDLIVNPTFLESTVLQRTGIVGDHLLERYRGAFAAVLKAQFTSKRLPGGEEGVTELGSQADLCRALLCEGLDEESLRDESSRPITLEALTKQRQREAEGRSLKVSVSRVKRVANSMMCGCAGVQTVGDEDALSGSGRPPLHRPVRVAWGAGEPGAAVSCEEDVEPAVVAAAAWGGSALPLVEEEPLEEEELPLHKARLVDRAMLAVEVHSTRMLLRRTRR